MKKIKLHRNITHDEKILFESMMGVLFINSMTIKLDTHSLHLENIILDQITLNDVAYKKIEEDEDFTDFVVENEFDVKNLSLAFGEADKVEELDRFLELKVTGSN